MLNRRQFGKGLVSLAFSGLATNLLANTLTGGRTQMPTELAYGKLIPDPKGVLDLPAGFDYKIISSLGTTMDDGLPVPNRADGMGCFALDEERVVLVRNHEISPPKKKQQEFAFPAEFSAAAYDREPNGNAFPGGTSNIVYNLKTGVVEKQLMSLLGTVRNCSGGVTPWNTWLTCEESVLKASSVEQKDHGYVFEVPANAEGLVAPVPLKAMGRFNHEAACVDPATGIVYLTEDRRNSLFYRFIPKQPGKLHLGGQLQALVVVDNPQFDTRNWEQPNMLLNEPMACQWIDLDNVESPDDDLRHRGHKQGAALFARGEGIHFGDNQMYFCCTNGGAKQLGQIMCYQPSPHEGTAKEHQQPGTLHLFVESQSQTHFNFGDNVVVADNGHLVVCEDQYTDTVQNHVKGVSPLGETYNIAKVRWQTEPAGGCFSPDGKTLFINLYSPTATVAITGPWQMFKSA
jgi:hypothetical protein